MSEQYVYFFGDGSAEAGQEAKALLGGKGANLGEMARIGVPVPPGFTITTEACRRFLAGGGFPEGMRDEVARNLRKLEESAGKEFGGAASPLLVSVRSGAAVSMPGMMDTVLNLGLNDHTAEALAGQANDRRFAFDSYRRFVQMYGNVVLGIAGDRFEQLLDEKKAASGADSDTALSADALAELVAEFKQLVLDQTGESFPEDPQQQLWGAIEAVFRSWDNARAIAYRRINHIPDDIGTAVNVVAMVFGNMGNRSGTGVAFTRNPATGEKALFGEFLLNAQGEDVVAGIRDPLPIGKMKERMPDSYRQLADVAARLEDHYRDVQDLEFTVEDGVLYMLQTRTAKRTAAAAVRIAGEMVGEGMISIREATLRVDPEQLDQLLHPTIDPEAEVEVIATGLPASPGAASGRVTFNPDEAARRGEGGEAVILVRRETSPEDYHGMVAARAIVTARGGMTSHAAVVARGMGKSCVVGASEIRINEAYGRFTAGDYTISENDWITVDGATGRIIAGQVPTREPELSDEFRRLMSWADEFRTLQVRANADTPADAAAGRRWGAEGIGLCRTEHMFFEGDRIDAVREMILAEDGAGRSAALEKLLPMQREDFIGIFRAMNGYPVTVRLLDPPLHEFLPQGSAETKSLARKMGVSPSALWRRVEQHRESNPMLGHRGVRLGISYPEITRMQARAIFEAAKAATAEGVVVHPEIMVPLVSTAPEFARQKAVIQEVAEEVLGPDSGFEYLIGTMIELPRAALTAGTIAEEAEFFSFGTNDLTQTVFGLSRDDASTFLPNYIEQGIVAADPFQTIDVDGVGALVRMATKAGRAARAGIKIGVCGEHGGDPASVAFFHETGLDYVSCSPFRVPVARLAAAHAALGDQSAVGSR